MQFEQYSYYFRLHHHFLIHITSPVHTTLLTTPIMTSPLASLRHIPLTIHYCTTIASRMHSVAFVPSNSQTHDGKEYNALQPIQQIVKVSSFRPLPLRVAMHFDSDVSLCLGRRCVQASRFDIKLSIDPNAWHFLVSICHCILVATATIQREHIASQLESSSQ